MSAEGSLPRDGDTGTTAEEVELAQVLESYLAQLEAGRPADPEGLIAAHPASGPAPAACLKVMHLAQGLDESGDAACRPSCGRCRGMPSRPCLCRARAP